MAAQPTIRLHGRDITEADARQSGEAIAEALRLVAANLQPGSDLRWRVARVDFMCDGCGFRAPFDAPRIAWTHRDGNDYCAACSCSPRQPSSTTSPLRYGSFHDKILLSTNRP